MGGAQTLKGGLKWESVCERRRRKRRKREKVREGKWQEMGRKKPPYQIC